MLDAVHSPRECSAAHNWYVVTTYVSHGSRVTVYGCTRCNASKQSTEVVGGDAAGRAAVSVTATKS